MKTRRRNQYEAQIQRAVCQHLKLRGRPGLVWFAVPNQGYRDARFAAILSGLGVRAGVSDLILLYEGKAFALEIKAPAGKLAESQEDFIEDFIRAGGAAACCWGIDAALKQLKDWDVIA